MAIYEVSSLDSIDYGAIGNAAVLQSVRFALASLINTCYMDRAFGLEATVDDPLNQVAINYSSTIIDFLESTIPDITVKEVGFETKIETGHIYPRVKVVINDG